MSVASVPEVVLSLTRAVGMKELADGLVLEGLSLAGYDLSGLKGDFLKFNRTDLERVDLSRAHLMDCDFKESKALKSVWDSVEAWQCYFDGSDFSESVASAARWTACSWGEVRFFNMEWTRVRAAETSFSKSIWTNSLLKECHFSSNSGFQRAQFVDSRIEGTRFEGVSFKGAVLRGVQVRDVTFVDCDFSEAIVDWGVLQEGAKFSGCVGVPFLA